MNTLCLQLLEATVTLYPANADDSPQTDAPIWSGAPAENLRLPEKWIKRQTRPSGAAYPVNHPLIPEYEITIGRVWVLETANLAGWQTGAGRYVLDITWVEAETLDWHRQTYYGVTVSERGQDARDVENGFLENQVFDAQYCVPAGGPAGSLPPLLPAAVPSTVVYTDATGSLTLYAYNATTNSTYNISCNAQITALYTEYYNAIMISAAVLAAIEIFGLLFSLILACSKSEGGSNDVEMK